MAACRKSVLSIIVQSQQRAEAYAAHPAAQGPLLRVQPVGENALVSGQVERFIFIRVVCFLKYRYIIGAACTVDFRLLSPVRISTSSRPVSWIAASSVSIC